MGRGRNIKRQAPLLRPLLLHPQGRGEPDRGRHIPFRHGRNPLRTDRRSRRRRPRERQCLRAQGQLPDQDTEARAEGPGGAAARVRPAQGEASKRGALRPREEKTHTPAPVQDRRRHVADGGGDTGYPQRPRAPIFEHPSDTLSREGAGRDGRGRDLPSARSAEPARPRRRHHCREGRRKPRRSLGIQRGGGGKSHLAIAHTGDIGGGARDRLHHLRLRGGPPGPDPLHRGGDGDLEEGRASQRAGGMGDKALIIGRRLYPQGRIEAGEAEGPLRLQGALKHRQPAFPDGRRDGGATPHGNSPSPRKGDQAAEERRRQAEGPRSPRRHGERLFHLHQGARRLCHHRCG